MQILGRMMKHFRLVSRMARSVDVDPEKAVDAGLLTQRDWARMVQTCRQCGWTGKCEDWLETHEQAGCAPGNCLNRARFEKLRAELAEVEEI